MSSIERSPQGRWHVHLLLEVPKRAHGDTGAFYELASRIWRALDWALPIVEFKDVTDAQGWIEYITKDASWQPDALDLSNLNP
jgi:hypothetical protein